MRYLKFFFIWKKNFTTFNFDQAQRVGTIISFLAFNLTRESPPSLPSRFIALNIFVEIELPFTFQTQIDHFKSTPPRLNPVSTDDKMQRYRVQTLRTIAFKMNLT